MSRNEATTTQHASATTPTATTAVASSGGKDCSPHALNEEDYSELMVDYNKSNSLSSPMDDEGSSFMWHGMDLLIPSLMDKPLL